MPTQVIRDGRICYEYTPQELAERRLASIIAEYVRNGQYKHADSSIATEQDRFKHKNRTKIPT